MSEETNLEESPFFKLYEKYKVWFWLFGTIIFLVGNACTIKLYFSACPNATFVHFSSNGLNFKLLLAFLCWAPCMAMFDYVYVCATGLDKLLAWENGTLDKQHAFFVLKWGFRVVCGISLLSYFNIIG